jgi:hypothetical protein
MKILSATWFTEMGNSRPIGIVLAINDEDGKPHAYIGNGEGLDEAQDAETIAMRGATFPLDVAGKLFGLRYLDTDTIHALHAIWREFHPPPRQGR